MEAVSAFVHDAIHAVHRPAPVEAEGEVALQLELDAEAGADERGRVAPESVAAMANDVADIDEGSNDEVPVSRAEDLLRRDAERSAEEPARLGLQAHCAREVETVFGGADDDRVAGNDR